MMYAQPVEPEYVITRHGGGSVMEALATAGALHREGRNIRVEGACFSSCAILITRFPQDVCVGPSALIGFHQARIDMSAGSRRSMWQPQYPAMIQSWIDSQTHGRSMTDALVYMDSRTAARFFRVCSARQQPRW